ncbi:His-Xaa-Ser system radical SAM maturase HxsC [Flammeovirga sp. SubArs3]|uniref:His-Xaa-Ser system radical SAM maturase HxsC n=1 Tax=Flammeovirga sp. SubArs3 TaxID=2995316 RepID=UPI00248B2AEE|nr:His-Xaa-Ser system radical SAM maturase HxsC [Flammeovirga sp. SubArs3]
MTLHLKGKAASIETVIVGKVIKNIDDTITLIDKNGNERLVIYYGQLLGVPKNIPTLLLNSSSEVEKLKDEDILLVNEKGKVTILYQNESIHNTLFITDRCNSNCLMCSQPPKDRDDLDFYFEVNKELIQLLPKNLSSLGITGGEPTLLGKRLPELLKLITEFLPDTYIHILTNGRSFAWKSVVKELAEVNNPNIVYGIPLYSDYYLSHDYIVQAKGAFNQTVYGIHNAARYGLRVEVRIVLHKQSYDRLFHLSEFIYMNMPFVEHIAFMGLEFTGYTPYNKKILDIEPSMFLNNLEKAISFLSLNGMNVSIYNLQHCLVSEKLWKFLRPSISDWKRGYLEECNRCELKPKCGGVFTTSKKYSEDIKAITNHI